MTQETAAYYLDQIEILMREMESELQSEEGTRNKALIELTMMHLENAHHCVDEIG